MKKKIFCLVLCLCTALSLVSPAMALSYMPDVTENMTEPSYWSDKQKDAEKEIMNLTEILRLDQGIIDAKGTSVIDFKTVGDTFDGLARNEAIKNSETEDAKYYFGWTYGPDGKKADWDYYQAMIDNCIDPTATEKQAYRFGIAVNRTTVRTFPSDNPIWDDPTDPDFNYQDLSGVRVNEPVLIYTTSADGKYFLARVSCCSGWIPVEDVAVCASREEWYSAWDILDDDVLVVCGKKLRTPISNFQPETSDRMLTMGTVLELVDEKDITPLIGNRAPINSYAVYLPVRNEDGSYRKMATVLPQGEDVHEGFLPLTYENIAKQALKFLGDAYGWGGMMQSEDCSSMVRMIYSCFGINIARNGNWQFCMPIEKLDLTNMSIKEKCEVLDQLPLGTALCFSGHEMLYLGKENGKYYVISNVSRVVAPDTEETIRIRGAVISTLDTVRPNGHTWIEDLNKAMMPAFSTLEDKTYDFPVTAWYWEAVNYCIGKGLMSGNGSDGFEPDKNATRATVVEALWKSAGKPESETELAFTDVKEAASYASAVRWAVEKGIVTGMDETTFAPDDLVTREQLAAILWRFAKVQGKDVAKETDLSIFDDVKQVSDYALAAMQWACAEKYISGTDEKTLSPQSNCTRAQLATILMRYVG